MGLVIARLVLALFLMLAAPFGARADADASALGRRAFEAGVDAASREAWSEAARAFETSLNEADRPATRFNLVLVYAELDQSLEVARHALAFLRHPVDSGRAAARARVERALGEATSALSVLTTESLPEEAVLQVDGAAPAVVDDARRVYLMPGVHHLSARLADGSAEAVMVTLHAGERTGWPRAITPPAIAQR